MLLDSNIYKSKLYTGMTEISINQKTKKGLFWKFTEQVATNGMQFVVGIIMARILSPSDYGVTALPAIFIALATTMIESGFGLALVRKPNLSEKDLSTAFYYSIGLGLFFYIVLYLLAPWIASFYKIEILESLIRISAITFLIGPIITPQNVILQRKIDFKTPARISIINKIAAGTIGIVAAYSGFGLWALVISSLSATILGLIQTWVAVKWLPKERFSVESFKYLWNYGNKIMISGLLGTLFSNLAPFFIGKFLGSTNLGLFNRANSYAKLPYSQVTNSIQSVTFPALSKLQDDDVALTGYYRKIIKTVCFFYFPIIILLIGLAKPIVILMLTAKWEGCVVLLQLLSIVMIGGPLAALNCNVLQVKGYSDLYLRIDVKKKTFELIITILTIPFGLLSYCCGLIVVQMYVLYVNLKCVGTIIPFGLLDQLKDLMPIFMISVLMLFTIFVLNLFLGDYLVQIFCSGTFSLLVYFISAHYFHVFDFREIKRLLNINKN